MIPPPVCQGDEGIKHIRQVALIAQKGGNGIFLQFLTQWAAYSSPTQVGG